MIGTKKFVVLGLVTFLLVFSGLTPVVANNWGGPLATDPGGDTILTCEDILSVDAQYANEFAYFRYMMNGTLLQWMWYYVFGDFDKNTSTGGVYGQSDIGYEFQLRCEILEVTPDIEVQVGVIVYGNPFQWVTYNMTANNGSALIWSDSSLINCFEVATLTNGSQGDLAFGVNWTWLCGQMALAGFLGDGCSMYLEFYAGWDSDWCPDRTGGATDYIEWSFCGGGGIPSFSASMVLFSLLTVLAVIVLLDRKRITI